VFLAFGAKIPSAMSTEHQDSSRNLPTAAKILWSFRPAIDGAFTVAGIAITALVISFIKDCLISRYMSLSESQPSSLYLA
jgi:hypothetical protein